MDLVTIVRSAPHPLPHKGYDKFPAIKHDYESDTIPDMYFAGTSTHSLDFRRSAGGFIHGYRYTGRSCSGRIVPVVICDAARCMLTILQDLCLHQVSSNRNS